MASQSRSDEVDLLVLAALTPAGNEVVPLAQRLGQPAETVHQAVGRLVEAGLVEVRDGSVTPTRAGLLTTARLREDRAAESTGNRVPTIDLSVVTEFIASRWSASAARHAAAAASRDELLASDAERDSAVRLLSEAFSQGRLSSTELEQRTDGALSARTHGELDAVLQGLGGLQRPVRSRPVQRAVFWVMVVLSSPFVLVGAMLLAFGSDVGDRVAGVVFLTLLLPGLFALRRWAAPSR